MKKRIDLALPEFLFIVATRAALGAGAGLLATARMGKCGRRRLGVGLFTAGALTTIPALWLLFGKEKTRPNTDAAVADEGTQPEPDPVAETAVEEVLL